MGKENHNANTKNLGIPDSSRLQYVDEYKLLNSTGWFDALILYETNSLFTPTPNGEVKINDHTAKRDIKSMLAQLQALSKGGELS